jgi:hypothetical protein
MCPVDSAGAGVNSVGVVVGEVVGGSVGVAVDEGTQ